MTQLTLKPIIKEILEQAGIEDVYDFAPSAKNCSCPIIIANETYEQTDLLEDCEYGKVGIDIIIVRETMEEAYDSIGKVIYTLHNTEWARNKSNEISIRGMTANGLPQSIERNTSGLILTKEHLEVSVLIRR